MKQKELIRGEADLRRVERAETPARWRRVNGRVYVQYDGYRAGWGWFPWPHGLDQLQGVTEDR